MFTGIVDHYGVITHIADITQGKCFSIQTHYHDLKTGESVAVDGVCLTVTKVDKDFFYCDISPETLAITTAGQLKIGSKVNLERSLRLSDRLSGHFVSGHVDQVCCVKAREDFTDFVRFEFDGLIKEASRLFVKKGSVAINGVSLTINKLLPDGFEVMLIPETLTRTNLFDLKPGNRVNIEYDLLAKLVAKQITSVELLI